MASTLYIFNFFCSSISFLFRSLFFFFLQFIVRHLRSSNFSGTNICETFPFWFSIRVKQLLFHYWSNSIHVAGPSTLLLLNLFFIFKMIFNLCILTSTVFVIQNKCSLLINRMHVYNWCHTNRTHILLLVSIIVCAYDAHLCNVHYTIYYINLGSFRHSHLEGFVVFHHQRCYCM